jgi:hypothetical protein
MGKGVAHAIMRPTGGCRYLRPLDPGRARREIARPMPLRGADRAGGRVTPPR